MRVELVLDQTFGLKFIGGPDEACLLQGGELKIGIGRGEVGRKTLESKPGRVLNLRVEHLQFRRVTSASIHSAVVAAVGQGEEAVRSRVSGTIHDLVRGYGQDQGASLRTFYIRERMCNWGFIGLNANRYEYDLALPLLSHQYLAWANALTMKQRQGRLAQVALLRDFDTSRGDGFRLADVKTADSSRGIGNVIRLAKKGIRKFVFGQDPRGEQGGARIFSAAMNCPDLAEALESLEQLTVFGRHFSRRELAENADSTGNLAGMFLSAAVVKCARSDVWFPARRPA